MGTETVPPPVMQPPPTTETWKGAGGLNYGARTCRSAAIPSKRTSPSVSSDTRVATRPFSSFFGPCVGPTFRGAQQRRSVQMSATNPTRVEVNEMLDEIEGHVRSTGCTIARDVSTTAEDGTPLLGYVVQHGDHQYNIVAPVGEAEVAIEYELNLVNAVAAERAQDAPDQDDGELVQAAAEDLRSAVEPEELPRISAGLRERVAVPPLAPNIMANSEFTYGFSLQDTIYPYEEMPSVSEFSDRTQSLVTVAWNAKRYLLEEYDVHTILGSAGTGDEELPPERGVQ